MAILSSEFSINTQQLQLHSPLVVVVVVLLLLLLFVLLENNDSAEKDNVDVVDELAGGCEVLCCGWE